MIIYISYENTNKNCDAFLMITIFHAFCFYFLNPSCSFGVGGGGEGGDVHLPPGQLFFITLEIHMVWK